MLWRREKKDNEQPKIDIYKRFGSWAFFSAIPLYLLIGTACVVSAAAIVLGKQTNHLTWLLFLHAFVTAVYLFRKNKLERLRTIFHELKHVALVHLTGNKFREISIGQGKGEVTYEVYQGNLHLEPFVIMAPYFFPLLSLPMLVAAFVAEFFIPPVWRYVIIYLLGLALGTDVTTSIGEIHEHQSDLKRVVGGFFTTRLFIFSFNLMWFSLCLLWALKGWRGYSAAFWSAARFWNSFID